MRALDCVTAASLLARGGVVAFPTETVYGLGVRGDDCDAVSRLYRLKSRRRDNPLIIHVSQKEQAHHYAVIDDVSAHMMACLWPGPVTFVLPRQYKTGAKVRAEVADNALAHLETIAIRVPSHPVAQRLLSLCDFPIAAPSANRSTYLSTTTAGDVAHALENCAIDGILDGGACAYGIESTILDMTHLASGRVSLLRQGSMSIEKVRSALPSSIHVSYDGDDTEASLPPVPKAPGMFKRHYAPHTPLRLDAKRFHDDEAVLLFGTPCHKGGAVRLNLSIEGNMTEAATNFYRMLHQLDRTGCRTIAVMPIPEEGQEKGLGATLNERLRRGASTHHTHAHVKDKHR